MNIDFNVQESQFSYSTISRFKEDDGNKVSWSVVIDFNESPAKQGNPSKGRARFLADEAPHERLVSGESFEFGVTKKAIVKIL